MVVLKGVEDNFEELTAIDSILYGAGDFLLHDSIVNYGVMGGELVATLGTGLQFVDPLQVYLPKRVLPLIVIIFILPELSSLSISRNMTESIFLPLLIFFVNCWIIQQRFPL